MSIRLEQVKKSFVSPEGTVLPILDVPELVIGPQEQIALIGSSGSGKTTLLHCIAGIVRPDSGRVLFEDIATHSQIDLAQLGESDRDIARGKMIGYVFQTHHLLSGFTALENVLLGMSFTGRRADRGWAEQLLREVGLGQRLHFKPAKLSVGQQQRVAVARALANRPKLVLADEPTGALDPASAQQVLNLIRKLCSDVAAALLLVTHDRDIASQLPRTLELNSINHAARKPAGGAA